MENFIEWLVILFFIISFLNSILKPKKTQQKRTPADTRERVVTSGPTVKTPDLQTDLEEVLRQRTRQAEKKKKELQSEFERRYSESKKSETTLGELSKKSKPVKIEEKPDSLTRLLWKEKSVTADSGTGIRKLLLDPESARRAVLLSEILGKPKALKRKW